jgi:hypothetical protein
MKGMATETKEPKSKAQHALELKKRYEDMLAAAKQEQLDVINGAVEALKGLGFIYTIHEGNLAPAAKSKATAGGKSAPKSNKPPQPEGAPPEGGWKYCPQHGWGDHDGRKHRLETIAAKKTQAPA